MVFFRDIYALVVKKVVTLRGILTAFMNPITNFMKKFFAIAAMLTTMFTANAQSNSCQDVKTFSIKPYIGISAGRLSTTTDQKSRYGLNVGVEGQYQFTKVFAISAGAAYSQQGGKMDGLNLETLVFDTKVDFINVPILANFYVAKGFALKIGFQPGFLVNNNIEVNLKSTGENVPGAYEDYLNKTSYSIPIGVSYEFNNIVFDARFVFTENGMYRRSDKDDFYVPVAGNGVGQITVGYRF